MLRRTASGIQVGVPGEGYGFAPGAGKRDPALDEYPVQNLTTGSVSDAAC